jgi:CHAT domain-containing protein
LKDDQGRYLIEDYPFHYLSTGRDLIRLQDHPWSGNGLLAIGDPDFDMSLTSPTATSIRSSGSSAIRFPSSGTDLTGRAPTLLPGTRTEINAVSALWSQNRPGPVLVLCGADATEENFKRSASGRQVIHIATHGFYHSDVDRPLDATQQLSGEPDVRINNNPFLQCGFLLAGANQNSAGVRTMTREDGIVTAEEVLGLNLEGTDLVVLSVCESGLGDVKSGEGVYGLRRAFQIAGARTIISALWRVDDRSTAEFMDGLFEFRDEAMPRLLQRIAGNRLSELRSTGKSDHPFYWAAFVSTGDWMFH